jgi:DUF971 family protein
MTTPTPSRIRLLSKAAELELSYPDGGTYRLSFEFLRVHSPSAEVKGHGPGTEVLQYGKQGVGITLIEPVGNYAIRIHFSDRHNSGLYDWNLLHAYCLNQDSMWQHYLARLEQAGKSRQPQ